MRAEELLEQDDLRELMSQRERPEREAVVAVELQAGRAADHEAEVAPRLAALLQPPREGLGVVGLAVEAQQRDERPVGDPPRGRFVLADLDELQARVAAQQPRIMIDVVDERWSQPPDGHDDHLHSLGD